MKKNTPCAPLRRLFPILLALSGLLFTLSARAQGGYVRGHVIDAFTGDGVVDARVAVVRTDGSAVADTFSRAMTKPGTDFFYPARFTLAVPAAGTYVLRIKKAGYEPFERRVEARFSRRNRYVDLGHLALTPKARELGEAAVKATKIKMVYRGDTLIYNADAFDLPDGSMLDDLIEQLPGAQLRDGRVYVNGRYVENILLSGKDFFNGNAQLALQNLPAYVVGKVKVYEREGERSKTMGRDMGDKSYVMDVHLKPDYQGSWTFDADLAYGTERRYSGTFFGLYVDRRQGLVLSADMNNLNLIRQRKWANGSATYRTLSGFMAGKSATANYHFEPGDAVRFTASADYTHVGQDVNVRTNEVTYLTAGDAFRRTETGSRLSSDRVNAGLGLALRPQKGRYVDLNYKMGYNRHHDTEAGRVANFQTDPDGLPGEALDSAMADPLSAAWRRAVTSRTLSERLLTGYEVRHEARAEAHFAFVPDLLDVDAAFSQTHKHDENFDRYRLDYPAGGLDTDFRRRYYDRPADNFRFTANAKYALSYVENDSVSGRIEPSYQFTWTRDEAQNPLYRLDSLPGWDEGSGRTLGALPSLRDSLQQCIDAENSYFSTIKTFAHRAGVKFYHKQPLRRHGWITLRAELPLRHEYVHLDYNRNRTPYAVSRRALFAEPSASVAWYPRRADKNGSELAVSADYSLRGAQPSAFYLIDVRDDSDPLHISLGNSGLDNTLTHSVSAEARRTWKKKAVSLSARLSYERTKNAVAMSQTYDRRTGAITSQPVNVDGNYLTNGSVDLSLPLDRAQKFTLNLYGYARYAHSRDLNYTAGMDASAISSVDNINTTGRFSIAWRPGKWGSLRANVKATHIRANGDRADFTPVRTTDMEYGLEGQANLPLDFTLSGNFGLTSYYGYGDSRMDRHSWDLNLRLDKSFIKGRLNLAVEGSNLLADDNMVDNYVNEQGRIETFRNVLPRYVLFHVAYKLNIAPKKRNR